MLKVQVEMVELEDIRVVYETFRERFNTLNGLFLKIGDNIRAMYEYFKKITTP